MAARLREAGRGLAIGWLLLAMLLGFAGPAHAEQRLALIIANEAYVSPSLGRLPGTRTDAVRMNAALTKAGFTVRTVQNTQKAAMQRAISDFVRDLAKAGQDGVGFLYYTGHGIADAKRGANYLIPVEADIGSTAELPLYALPMDDVLDAIEGAGAKAAFVVFDACRSTPTSLSRGSKGLLPSRGRTDTLVAFATAPGETAEDDGLYSRVLADHLTRAGANSTTLFAEVQSDVARASGRRQVPQFSSSLVDAVQFVAGPNLPAPPIAPRQTTGILPNEPSAGWRQCDGTAPSGLGTMVLKDAPGPHPKLNDFVMVTYTGFLAADGSVFDHNEKSVFRVSDVIKGVSEGLMLMTSGSKWRFCVPAALGYGAKGTGGGKIPANSDLVFQFELLDFKSDAEMAEMRRQAGQ